VADEIRAPGSQPAAKTTAKPEPTAKKPKARRAKKKTKGVRGDGARTRTSRPYPASSFEEALPLAGAIHQFASGERVRRLTLLRQMNRSPTSSVTKMLITNSGKYAITKGSYSAEWLDLTSLGRIATAPDTQEREKLEAQFTLAIKGVEPFNYLYEQYKGKKLPSHEVMKDALRDAALPIEDEQECIDTFIVNAKFLGLLRTIAGAETLLPIDHVLDDVPSETEVPSLQRVSPATEPGAATRGGAEWSRMCFYVAPIGSDGSDSRKHSDLFLGSLVEPALKDFPLEVIRADQIAEPGVITGQVIEHIMRARLVIADLSYHNPNVFYEMALRHARRLPIVQICRKQDTLPFDVNQMRTIVIDTTDIYTLVPKLETYRSEIASQVRTALNDTDAPTNPISVFFPGFSVVLPTDKKSSA
jgi:hypothetical protein